jgi:hypothetical protein
MFARASVDLAAFKSTLDGLSIATARFACRSDLWTVEIVAFWVSRLVTGIRSLVLKTLLGVHKAELPSIRG